MAVSAVSTLLFPQRSFACSLNIFARAAVSIRCCICSIVTRTQIGLFQNWEIVDMANTRELQYSDAVWALNHVTYLVSVSEIREFVLANEYTHYLSLEDATTTRLLWEQREVEKFFVERLKELVITLLSKVDVIARTADLDEVLSVINETMGNLFQAVSGCAGSSEDTHDLRVELMTIRSNAWRRMVVSLDDILRDSRRRAALRDRDRTTPR